MSCRTKTCQYCRKTKSIKKFRYFPKIKNFRKYCYACEKEHQKKSIKIENHIHILKRSNNYAKAKTRECLKQQSTKNYSKYIVYKIFVFFLPITSILFLIVISLLVSDYQSFENGLFQFTSITALLFFTSLLSKYIFLTKEIRLILKNEKNIKITFYNDLMEGRKNKSNFYNSTDWKQLRMKFIKDKRKEANKLFCTYCSKELFDGSIVIDHIKPRATYPDLELDITNLTLSCWKCNKEKSDKIPNATI